MANANAIETPEPVPTEIDLKNLSPEKLLELAQTLKAKAEGEIKAKDDAYMELAHNFLQNAKLGKQEGFPHPRTQGLSTGTATDPMLLIMRLEEDEEGNPTLALVKNAAVEMTTPTKTSRKGSGKKNWADYGLRTGDVVRRKVIQGHHAKQSGFEIGATVSFKVLDALGEAETRNADGRIFRENNPSGLGRRTLGAKATEGKFQPSLDGPDFWFRHESCEVVRGDRILRFDNAGMVVDKAA
jgi:hypothetical protein